MKRALVTMVKTALCAGAIISCLLSPPARAQVEVEVAPPPEIIATTRPVYFEGHAAYWYGNRWYYRDGGNWRFYHEEPGYLRGYRGHYQPVRVFYGREHGGGFRRR